MSGLAESFRTLPRFPQGVLSAREVATFMGFTRARVSMRELQEEIDKMPVERDFQFTIVTGAELGGALSLTLNKNGHYRFSGRMRATGFLSFDYAVTAIVRSPDNQVLVAARHSGQVFGTDTPGNRQDDWDEKAIDPERAKVIRNTCPTIRRGTLDVRRTSEMAGVLGTSIDIATEVVKFFVVAQTLGGSAALCLFIGAELGEAGIELPGLGGVVGVGIVAGAVMIWGPLAMVPAIVAGVAIGAVIDVMVIIRKLRDEEIAFARTVFADSIDFTHVRITNLLGMGDRRFVMPTIDNHILVNLGNVETDPIRMSTIKYPVAGQLLIHELVHVWQIQHRSLTDGFVPGFLCEAGVTQAEGADAYRPGAPGPPWDSFGMEAQGSIVDRWFAGSPDGRRVDMQKERIPMNPANPYARYVLDNVQLGHP